MTSPSLSGGRSFQLRFPSGFFQGRTVSIRCDPCGNVDINRLSESERRDYFYGRLMVRLWASRPEVVQVNHRIDDEMHGPKRPPCLT